MFQFGGGVQLGGDGPFTKENSLELAQLGLNQGPPGPLMSQLGGVSIKGVMVSGA